MIPKIHAPAQKVLANVPLYEASSRVSGPVPSTPYKLHNGTALLCSQTADIMSTISLTRIPRSLRVSVPSPSTSMALKARAVLMLRASCAARILLTASAKLTSGEYPVCLRERECVCV